ncbi:hypothetical protein KP509_01G063600 [Ceratopteris richardii]|nr:hypothetical protein KP509_01G063600 [Ceratopteris richardii]
MATLSALISARRRKWLQRERHRPPLLIFSAVFFILCRSSLSCLAESLQFSFTSFNESDGLLTFSEDSNVDNYILQITRNSGTEDVSNSSGQVTYAEPLQLWSSDLNYSASFNTTFLLNIAPIMDGGTNATGGGLTFMLSSAAAESNLPNSFGEWLGLFDGGVAEQDAQRVGIEFDTFMDSFDPDDNHVGIDVNGSVESIVVASLSPDVSLTSSNVSNREGMNTSIWIEYDGDLHILSVYVANQGSDISTKPSEPVISYAIDLRDYLPEIVYVGFSASLGTILESHCIILWDFTSTDVPSSSSSEGLIIGAIVAGVAIILLAALLAFFWIRRRNRTRPFDSLTDLQYGPREFRYRDLKKATDGFSDKCRLGQGGFGPVYKGELLSSDGVVTQVAVKCLARKSEQGEREFIAEVTSMGRMKHRNLVQLLGWSYERKQLMLVYQYMPNGSLDRWIRIGQPALEVMGWERRFHVMKGVAAGLLYLHEEWEMVVIHRDLKPSNVMLDAEFNARIGDFGLAKFIDMKEDSAQTITIAGTPGYIAPECIEEGVVSKETDIYSLGAIAIELATGRRISISFLLSLSRQLEEGSILEIADPRLSDVNATQLELVLRIGVACCHPNPSERPLIREVVHALSSVGGSYPPLAIPFKSSPYSYDKPYNIAVLEDTSTLLTPLLSSDVSTNTST